METVYRFIIEHDESPDVPGTADGDGFRLVKAGRTEWGEALPQPPGVLARVDYDSHGPYCRWFLWTPGSSPPAGYLVPGPYMTADPGWWAGLSADDQGRELEGFCRELTDWANGDDYLVRVERVVRDRHVCPVCGDEHTWERVAADDEGWAAVRGRDSVTETVRLMLEDEVPAGVRVEWAGEYGPGFEVTV